MPEQSEGLTLLAAALVRAAREQLVPRRDPLIRDVYDAYLLAMEASGELAPGTMEVCAHARRSLWPLLEGVRASAMSADLTSRLLAEMQAPPDELRLSTARVRLQRLGRAWSWALERRMVEQAWCPPRRKRTRKERRDSSTAKVPYTVRQLYSLLVSLDGPYHVAMRLLSETGARGSEVLSLDVGDVRHDGARWWAHMTDAKSGMPRPVPLRDETADMLDLGRDDGAPLVTGTQGGRLLLTTLRNVVARTLDRLAIRRRVGPESARRSWSHDVHSTRRSFAAHAAAAGLDGLVVDRLCGWAPKTMRDHYRRHSVTREQLVAGVDAVVAYRQATIQGQVLAAQGRAGPPWTGSTASPRGIAGGQPASTGVGALGSTPRTCPSGDCPKARFLTARMAAKRAAVRLAGLRGFALHAQPEVFSVT